MAGFNFQRAQATADRLIKRYGQAGKLRHMLKSGPAYDPTLMPVDVDARFAVLGYETHQIDGTRILATDKMVYLSAVGLTVEPKIGMTLVESDGGLYTVVDTDEVKPGSVVVYRELQVRR
jgi:hypothetical protein